MSAKRPAWLLLEDDARAVATEAGWCGHYCREHGRTCRVAVPFAEADHDHLCLLDTTRAAPPAESAAR